MSLKKLVLRWNDQWRYDLWFRRKYSIMFNSKQHRDSNQIDIAFEYIEYKLEEQEKKRWEKIEEDQKFRKGNPDVWIRPVGNDKEIEKGFEDLDFSQLK